MSFRCKFLVIFIICTIPRLCFSQSPHDQVMEQVIEYIAENVSGDKDYSELTERLNFYLKNPLNINTASREQLQEFLFISPVQINNLLLHREESGLLLDPLEIQSIPGFDTATTRWLSHFITIKPPETLADISLKSLFSKANHDLILRFGKILEKQDGFLPSGSAEPVYSGSSLRIFTRYRYNYADKISVSLNMEKDAGETFLKSPGKGFDFYSASVSLKGKRMVRKFVLGDYSLQFGQGLTMWSGLGFGKGGGLTALVKQDIGLRSYSSVNEFSFLRGISATLGLKRISVTPFLSYRKLDASISDSVKEINSLNISGLHRTETELENKSSVSQFVYGLNSQYLRKNWSIGFTAYNTQFSMPFAEGNSLYEKYEFNRGSLVNLGVHYNYAYKNAYFFGEAAHSLSSGFASINGLIASLSGQVSLLMLHRNYASNYHSFFNQSISEATEASNEKGFYSGLNIKFNSRFELLTYADFFRFPWLKFRVDAPSNGYELFAQLSYSLSKRFKVTARFKQQMKEENAGPEENEGLEDVNKHNYRIEINYKLNNSFSLRNRAEISSYRKGNSASEFGFLSYQDIIYDPLSSKLSGSIRFAIFDSPAFTTRIYAYENDVLYAYSIPAYQGRGLRCYANLRYTFHRGVDIWVRYAILGYSNQETVGSGRDMIQGNQRSDFKVQLRYQF